MNNEIWKDIQGFEGRYQVSDAGRVKSLVRVIEQPGRFGGVLRRTMPGAVMTPRPATNGYLRVQLGRGREYLIHRLVAAAFIPGDTTLQVNHKNGDRADNSVANLEWATCSDNHRHSYRELPRKEHALTTPVKVGARTFSSILDAARALGVNHGSVSSALNRGHRCRGEEVTYG